jgi:hypothetical protein
MTTIPCETSCLSLAEPAKDIPIPATANVAGLVAAPARCVPPADGAEECKRRLCCALLVNSYIGLVLSLILAGFIGIFASDSPSSTIWDSVVWFAVTLLLACPPLVILPRWAARRVLAPLRPRLGLAIVHSLLLAVLLMPLGLLMASFQVYYCARLVCRSPTCRSNKRL